MYGNFATKCCTTVGVVLEWIRMAQDKVLYGDLVNTTM